MYVRSDNTTVIKYPYTMRDLREEYPNVSFPRSYPDSVLANYGVYPVVETIKPSFDPDTERVVEINPTESNGVWMQAWEVQALDSNELHNVKVSKRIPTSLNRLKNILTIPAIKELKTLSDAQAIVDSQVSNLTEAKAFMAKLLYATVNTGRAYIVSDNSIFPGDE